MKAPHYGYSFSMTTSGRCGSFTYTEAGKILDVDWEMSGVSHYDILIAPVDLREWQFPQGEKISEDQQKIILARLRDWLAAQRFRTDIDLPQFTELSGTTCLRAGCYRTLESTQPRNRDSLCGSRATIQRDVLSDL
jgi:hypothetical protein